MNQIKIDSEISKIRVPKRAAWAVTYGTRIFADNEGKLQARKRRKKGLVEIGKVISPQENILQIQDFMEF